MICCHLVIKKKKKNRVIIVFFFLVKSKDSVVYRVSLLFVTLLGVSWLRKWTIV
jgi:hypothetical protein